MSTVALLDLRAPRPSYFRRLVDRATRQWRSRSEWQRDAVLYALAALFAGAMGVWSTQPAQWQWGYLTVGPYAVAALVALAGHVRRPSREIVARSALLVAVVVGAVVVPLGLEAHWRQLDPGLHYAQPEVGVIERSGQALSQGQDPYRAYESHGHLVGAVAGVPAFESFFPYFPLMGVFGLPSADTKRTHGLTDARIVMTVMTLLVGGWALSLLRVSRQHKIRVAQLLIALPTGALFLSTGGDDMPILALSLLGVAALQRRRSNLAGVALALGAAMKLTAWPLAAGSLLVARDRQGRSTWWRVAAWIVSIVLVTVLPFVVKNPRAFVINVFAFPLGLAGVSSPAASALPGHELTTWFPFLGHVLTPLALLVGGYVATRYARRHWPLSLSRMLAMLSAGFVLMICVASATRAGYVIYPLNLLLWSYVCRDADVDVSVDVDAVTSDVRS